MSTQKSEENKKELILKAALDCFTKNRIDTVTMDVIAKEAGISKGLIYFYYKSKDDLIYELCESWCKESDEALFKMAVECDLKDLIYEYPKFLFAHTMINTHHQFFMQLWSRSIEDEQLRNRLSKMHHDHHRKHVEFLKMGVKKEFLKHDTDVESLAILFHAIFDGLLVQWHYDPSIDLIKQWKKSMDYLFYGVGMIDTRITLDLEHRTES
jgi:AcrR family transcriptional regulator